MRFSGGTGQQVGHGFALIHKQANIVAPAGVFAEDYRASPDAIAARASAAWSVGEN